MSYLDKPGVLTYIKKQLLHFYFACNLCVCVCVGVCLCMYVCMCVYIYIYIYIYIYTHTHIHIRTYIHAYMHTYIQRIKYMIYINSTQNAIIMLMVRRFTCP